MTPRQTVRSTHCALLVLVLLLAWGQLPALAEPWLCPDCPNEIVDRPAGAKELVCPGCGKTYSLADLTPPVMYINSRTRDAEVAWVVESDTCDMFRMDGFQAFDDKGGTVWVPWSAIDWYIPRMELVKLHSGKELTTDYPRGGETTRCVSPPKFSFEVSDSLNYPGQAPTTRKYRQDENMADLFIVAVSPEERDSARARFINEVETGKRPRLPRTQPTIYHQSTPATPPPQAVKEGWKGETLLEVHVSDGSGVLGLRTLQSSGHPELDKIALDAARWTGYLTAGEMGVPVPAWVRVRVTFDGAQVTMKTEKSPNGFWRR